MAVAQITAYNDFLTFKNDAPTPVFTVVDADGNAMDISAATDIGWTVFKPSDNTVLLNLTKIGGQIAFVTDGKDGKFIVNISTANTAAIGEGWFNHGASITIGAKLQTCLVGRVQVGSNWTYNPAQVASVPMFQVRRLVGDVISNEPQVYDTEILYAISVWGNVWLAAAEIARDLAAQYSRKVPTSSPGPITTDYGQQAKHYLDLATSLSNQGMKRGAGVFGYAGGISVQNKVAIQSNTDRVQPSFNIAMQDNNMIPVSQVGNEMPILPLPAPGA